MKRAKGVLRKALEEMNERRASHVAAIAEIDAELAEVGIVVGDVPQASAAKPKRAYVRRVNVSVDSIEAAAKKLGNIGRRRRQQSPVAAVGKVADYRAAILRHLERHEMRCEDGAVLRQVMAKAGLNDASHHRNALTSLKAAGKVTRSGTMWSLV